MVHHEILKMNFKVEFDYRNINLMAPLFIAYIMPFLITSAVYAPSPDKSYRGAILVLFTVVAMIPATCVP